MSQDDAPREGFLRRNAWPIGILGIIVSFTTVQSILIANAFRDDGFGPEQDYYEKSLRHDDVMVAERRAHEAGLSVAVSFGDAPLQQMPRRVDVRVKNRAGEPVTGLAGTLTAIRPSDIRLRNSAELIAVPNEPGLYRLLLRLPEPGLWLFELDARQGTNTLRVVVREDVAK